MCLLKKCPLKIISSLSGLGIRAVERLVTGSARELNQRFSVGRAGVWLHVCGDGGGRFIVTVRGFMRGGGESRVGDKLNAGGNNIRQGYSSVQFLD